MRQIEDDMRGTVHGRVSLVGRGHRIWRMAGLFSAYAANTKKRGHKNLGRWMLGMDTQDEAGCGYGQWVHVLGAMQCHAALSR